MNTLNENLLRNLIYLRELAIAAGNIKRLAELNIALSAHREVMKKDNVELSGAALLQRPA